MIEKFFELFEDFFKDNNETERNNVILALMLNNVYNGTQGT